MHISEAISCIKVYTSTHKWVFRQLTCVMHSGSSVLHVDTFSCAVMSTPGQVIAHSSPHC